MVSYPKAQDSNRAGRKGSEDVAMNRGHALIIVHIYVLGILVAPSASVIALCSIAALIHLAIYCFITANGVKDDAN